jgi:peptidoglycan/xylan/chitin deacetylase (PgdA/CDA1 family)
MNLALSIKLGLYRFFGTKVGQLILNILSIGVYVDNLQHTCGKSNNKHPFNIVITVDTESGYVESNERRVWQNENPDAYQGYISGINNLIKIFDKHNIKASFLLSTNCFNATGRIYKGIIKEIKEAMNKGHEIGLHMHPDSDIALQKKLKRKFKGTSAFFLSYGEKLLLLNAGLRLLKDHLGINPKTFRWGNWALDTEGAEILDKTGFKIDSSATPGIKGHTGDYAKYDWSCVNERYPWILNTKNYQDKNGNSKTLEIPIATFKFFGIPMRADPVNLSLLYSCFLKYYKRSDRTNQPFPFVIITHSSEATTKDGKPTKTLQDLDKFIRSSKRYNGVKFTTLSNSIKAGR